MIDIKALTILTAWIIGCLIVGSLIGWLVAEVSFAAERTASFNLETIH